METKICSLCKTERTLDRFSYRNKHTKQLRHDCKDCINKNRMNQPNYGIWHKNNKPRLKAYNRNNDLRRHYGLTIEQFNEMLKNQNGQCKICGTTKFKGKGQKPHVDHCHTTGKIRGLLCNECNIGLGAYKDNPELMLKAIEYLKETK